MRIGKTLSRLRLSWNRFWWDPRNLSTEPSGKLGLEVELSFTASVVELSYLKKIFCEEFGFCPTLIDYETFVTATRHMLFQKFDNLLLRVPDFDEDGIELVFKPFTREQLYSLKSEIKCLFEICKRLHFNPTNRSGIHVNFDVGYLDNDKKIKRFFGFLTPNTDLCASIHKFTERKGKTSLLASTEAMLGDLANTKSINTLEEQFKGHIKEIISIFRGNHSVCLLNFCFFKDKRPAIEWRWFASTNDYSRFFEIVEFVDTILLFAEQTNSANSIDVHTFNRFARTRNLHYFVGLT